MKCYTFMSDYETNTSMTYTISQDQTRAGVIPFPFPENAWVPRRDIRYEHGGIGSYGAVLYGGKLTQKTKMELRKLWFVTSPNDQLKRETVGVFTINLNNIPLVSEVLMLEIAAFNPDLFEFVKIEKVWDETHNCLLDGAPFYLANLLIRHDGWDKEKTEINSITRPDGTSFNLASGGVIAGPSVMDAVIWRDSVTADVVCTEVFRDFLIGVGCRGWCFTEVPVSDG